MQRLLLTKNDLKLILAQTMRLNQRVCERGLGMGAIFVHKLTSSDINRILVPTMSVVFHFFILVLFLKSLWAFVLVLFFSLVSFFIYYFWVPCILLYLSFLVSFFSLDFQSLVFSISFFSFDFQSVVLGSRFFIVILFFSFLHSCLVFSISFFSFDSLAFILLLFLVLILSHIFSLC
jgi:hypothetical protein